MSPYEILAVAALACAAGFAWHLYRKDTRPGAAERPSKPAERMFKRD
jgi:hypothetical protein